MTVRVVAADTVTVTVRVAPVPAAAADVDVAGRDVVVLVLAGRLIVVELAAEAAAVTKMSFCAPSANPYRELYVGGSSVHAWLLPLAIQTYCLASQLPPHTQRDTCPCGGREGCDAHVWLFGTFDTSARVSCA